MLRTVAPLVAVLSIAAAPLAAQTVDTVPEPRTPAKLALVRELMATANFRDQLVRTMRESSTRTGAMTPVPPGFWDKFIARAEQDADTLLAPMVEDYARYFTSADLRALIAFYKTPAGQRMSFAAPVISANSSYVGAQWGARVGMEIVGELMKGGAPAEGADAQAKATKKP